MNALGLQDSHCIVLGVVLILCAVVDLLQIRGKNTRWLAGSVLPYYTALALLIVAIGVFGIYGAGFDAQDFVYFKY